MAKLNLGRVGLVPQGTYDSAKTYAKLDVVFYPATGSSYVSLIDNNSAAPGDATRWQSLADVSNEIAAANAATARANAAAEAAEELSDEVTDLNSHFNDMVASRYSEVEYTPNAIESDASMSVGYVAKNGSLTENVSYKHTDFIQVKEGDVLRAYYVKSGVFITKGLRFVCCYDSNQTPISAKGTNTAVSEFTVPEDIEYVKVTMDGIDANVSSYMLSINYVATEYTGYTAKIRPILDDFLSVKSSETVQKLNNNGFKTSDLANAYGCALPQNKIFQTVGLPEKWYRASMVTPPTTNISVSAGIQYSTKTNDGLSFPNTAVITSSNGYSWNWYDMLYKSIRSSMGKSGFGWGRSFIAENLPDCSLLAIGDSTVDHDSMTATLLSHFAEQGRTITLLGTLGDGSGTNRNEGRAGWSAQDYLTDRQYQGITNPFYNPNTQTFDFSYYMTNQGYTTPDFVVLQLGINDLYNYDDTRIEPTWDAMETIIDSILAYNNSIKIILNLPTTPNNDQSQLGVAEFLYRNRVIRYNEYAMQKAYSKYEISKVRCSYCHLILDPATEIRDNIHPTSEGYAKMALEVINQINNWQNDN